MTDVFDPDRMDLDVGDHLICYRRRSGRIIFGIAPGATLELTAEETEIIARNLLVAASNARLASTDGALDLEQVT